MTQQSTTSTPNTNATAIKTTEVTNATTTTHSTPSMVRLRVRTAVSEAFGKDVGNIMISIHICIIIIKLKE